MIGWQLEQPPGQSNETKQFDDRHVAQAGEMIGALLRTRHASLKQRAEVISEADTVCLSAP